MKIAVLGAGGGLGRNVVEAALTARHEVVALVRDAKRAELPAAVAVFAGDATRIDDVARAMDGADATMFCVNPPFATWLTTFQPLLDASLAGAKRTGTRLIFPANAWIYGPGNRGELVDEVRAATPASKRGALRAQMEEQIRAAGIRYAMIRLPEFYGAERHDADRARLSRGDERRADVLAGKARGGGRARLHARRRAHSGRCRRGRRL